MEKIKLKIRVYGDPILACQAKLLFEISDYHHQLLNDMARIMYEVSGIGLAAPQLGVDAAMFVADCGSGLYKLINPKIISAQGSQVMEEGCLSAPGIGVKVRRAKKITLEAQDETGKLLKLEAEDLLARVFQHEIDHLKGKLIIDHAYFLERFRIKQKLKHLKEIG